MKQYCKRWKVIFTIIAILLVFVYFYGMFIYNNPKDSLQHSLNINELPELIEIQEYHENWTDSICSYYIRINSSDFDKIVSGRKYEYRTDNDDIETTAMWIVPEKKIKAKHYYRYIQNSYDVKITANIDKSEVIILYSSD